MLKSTLAVSFSRIPEGSEAYAFTACWTYHLRHRYDPQPDQADHHFPVRVCRHAVTIIGLTSVISAISANVRLRAREFAVLQSVGMTQGGIRRMLALESVMSSLKALLYGIPLGSAAMYLTFLAITTHNSFPFVYPWVTLLEVIAGVFLITLITTQYAAAKLRKNSSLMDAIRSTEGV